MMNDQDGVEFDRQRYYRALHAMQSGVRADHANGGRDGSPKHLRTGVNAAVLGIGALAGLLIEKGLFTEAEYIKALADGMEAEKARYEKVLSERFGNPVHLY